MTSNNPICRYRSATAILGNWIPCLVQSNSTRGLAVIGDQGNRGWEKGGRILSIAAGQPTTTEEDRDPKSQMLSEPTARSAFQPSRSPRAATQMHKTTPSRPVDHTSPTPPRQAARAESPGPGGPPPTRVPARHGKTLTQGRHCKLAPTWRARCGLTPCSATLRFGDPQVRRASGWATLRFGDPQVGRPEPEGGDPQVRATLRFGV